LIEFWREAQDGVRVMVKVQPKSRRPGLLGAAPAADGMRLRIGVAEAPEDGRATRAACAALAAGLGVAASAVTLEHGAASREKLLHVAGDPADLAIRLASLA
jgi:hypothetical protein